MTFGGSIAAAVLESRSHVPQGVDGIDTRAYTSDYEPPRADYYRVNTMTGERSLIAKGQLTQQFGIAPNGKHWIYWKDLKFHAYDLATGKTTVLGGTTAPVFTSTQFDYPGPKPPFGVAGYAKDGSSVL